MLGQRRRWANIMPALGHYLCLETVDIQNSDEVYVIYKAWA